MRRSRFLALTLLLLALGACATRRARQPPEMSGFLDDYSLLREGGHGEVALVYRNPDADWRAYDKVLLEHVTLWRSGRKSLDPVPEADLLQLIADLEGAVRRRLGEQFALVEEPGPGVMRIRFAITEARATDPILDVLRGRGNAATAAPDAALHPETRRFIEAAAIEGEIRDARTDKLLAAGVEHRRRKNPLPIDTWAEVNRALDFWAARLVARLEARTQGGGTP